ncbi:hypothetical protein [Streptomyces sp. NPDC050564]|uniref:hypothetical protein n=1 Tax=Streptomyces sp. NPDC050564 TaxID=3365631 RepID=UPI0037AF435F
MSPVDPRHPVHPTTAYTTDPARPHTPNPRHLEQTMTDQPTRPWFDDQITAHAIWLQKTHGDSLETLTVTETADDHGMDTSDWRGEDWDAYIDAVWKILRNAPNLTEWAINLGADGLQPDEHQLTWSAGDQPIVRVHLAFHSGMHAEARDYLVTAVGEALHEEMQRAAAVPAVDASEACGNCRQPFDPTDTRFDGQARSGNRPFCRRCVDRCHESTDFAHECAVCR